MAKKSVSAEHSPMFEEIQEWYNYHFWTKNMVKNAVKRGKITPEEYKEITGEDYTE